MKKGLNYLILLVSLFLINFVSAQFYSGYGFGFGSFLSTIDPIAILEYGALFAVFFGPVYFALSKFFKDEYGNPNRVLTGSVSGSVATLIIIGLNRTGFSLEDLFSGIGISTSISYPVFIIISTLFLGFIFWIFGRGRNGFSLRRGIGWLLTISGLLILGVAIFTDLIYESGVALVIGILFLILGFFMWRWSKSGMGFVEGVKRKPMWAVTILGIILTVGGFLLGQGIIIVIGILITGIGLFGKKVYGETFAQGKEMSPRRAEKEAYKEKARRESQTRRIWAEKSRDLQKLYDKQKKIYTNSSVPFPTRQAAAAEMQKLVAYANREGLHLNP